jgi:hypothetical protein
MPAWHGGEHEPLGESAVNALQSKLPLGIAPRKMGSGDAPNAGLWTGDSNLFKF